MESANSAVDERIMAHLDFARAVATRTIGYQTRPGDREDLLAWGALGLVQAARRYREDVGATFAAYAARRVRGCVLDALRAADPLTRKERRAFREVVRLHPDAPTPRVELSLDALLEEGRAGPESVMWVDDSPVSALGRPRDARWHGVASKLRGLPAAERRVLVLSYARGLTLREIGVRVGLSESGVCRLRTRALAHVRRACANPAA